MPVFKKNDHDDVHNYRGITLVSCMSKLFTSILNSRLNNWIENNNILSDAQFGFRKGRSTTDAIFVLNAIIQNVVNSNGRLFCCFIDMKRAFDSVYLNGLWYKLYNAGINGKLLTLTKEMYHQVKCCVKKCNSYSDFFNCAIGLKQGEVLSPVLLSLFLDDLELFLEKDVNSGLSYDDLIFILMLFADDMVIFGKSVTDHPQSINNLSEYCDLWGLEVNISKTKVMVFRKRGPTFNNEKWSFKSEKLDIVDDFNY